MSVKDNLAYVCSADTGINIYDVTDPATPVLRRTVGPGAIGCKMVGELLLTIQGFVPNFSVQVYSLRNDPVNPTLLGNSGTINYNLPIDLQGISTHAFVAQYQFCFFTRPNPGDIFSQTGDLLTVALNLNNATNPTAASPALVNVLFNTNGDAGFDPTDVPGCAENGGDHNVWQLAQADAQTLLMASTTATGTDTQTGVGNILVVDIANPARPRVLRELAIPGTVHAIGIAVDGNRALVVGSTGGLNDGNINDPLITGTLVFTVLDLTEPRNPRILASRTISRLSHTFFSATMALGNGLFAFANLGGAGEVPQLLLINARNPRQLAISQTDAPQQVIGPNGIAIAGNLLFSTNDTSGLLIYRLGALPTVPITARVSMPTNTGVALVPNSFNTPPTRIERGANADTLVWELILPSGPSSETLTWQTSVTNLQPGEARDITLPSRVEFVAQGTPGHVPLAPVTVSSAQILALQPSTRTVRPGEGAMYTLTARNPTAVEITYMLSVQGVPQSWVALASSVTVPAQGAIDLPLTLTAETLATLATYGFIVNASAPTGALGAVRGTLILQGTPVPVPLDTTARGLVLALTPTQASAGQGTTAVYTLRLTNTGSTPDRFLLTGAFPAGVMGTFAQSSVDVPPGVNNFRELALALTPQAGTPPGDVLFSVTATSVTVPTTTAQAQGSLTVLGHGVDVTLSPRTGVPGGTYQLTVTNTGQSLDTFDVTLAGPAGLVATLPVTNVTLAPNTSQVLTIPVGAINFALPGMLNLTAVATSRTNRAVQDASSAFTTIAPVQGLTAETMPAVLDLPLPGTASLLVQVSNRGNIEDTYTATIASTSGALTAELVDLDGQPTHTVPLFRLPGLSAGALTLRATQTRPGTGTVTVRVTSLTTPAVTTLTTAMLRAGGNQAPIARGGQDRAGLVGQMVLLDGQASTDPDAGPQPLAFHWRFLAVPAGSALTNAAIQNAATALARFTPDVVGLYTVELLVSDGLASAVTTLRITVGSGAVGLRDVSERVEVSVLQAQSTLDRQSRAITSSAEILITNISTVTFRAPLQAQVMLSDPGVEVLEAEVDATGQALVDLSALLPGGMLRPGESLTLPLTFVRPFPGRLTYEIRILGALP